jgi:L-fucose dehydrogenase
MDLEIEGKVFIVTGGSRGIGQAISQGLAEEGAIPVIVSRNAKANQEFEQSLKKLGFNCYSICTELKTKDSCRKVIEEVLGQFNHIDGLINNAGVNDGVSLEKGVQEFEQSILGNLSHYFFLAHYALPALKDSKGSILNISSKTALTGQGGTSAYAAAKGAQLALTREWAVELLPFKIRVNAIVPAEVMTPLYKTWLNTFENPDGELHRIENNIPFGKRMTKAKEIGDLAAFILSPRSGHTTGQWLHPDGGYVHLDRSLK